MRNRIKLWLILINLFLSFIIIAQDKIAQDKNEEKKSNIKIPYSYKPSFLSFGFDLYQFTKNLLTSDPSFATNNKNYDLDFRWIFSIDFNKILLDVNAGLLLVKKDTTDTEHSVLLKINALCNLLKKNSDHNVFFVGGGININATKMKKCEKNINTGRLEDSMNDKFCWGWCNFSIGVRKTLFKWCFAGASYTFNFFPKQLYTPANRYISQERVYGFGFEENSIGHFLSIYIGLIIPLLTEDKRVKDEEYYFNLDN